MISKQKINKVLSRFGVELHGKNYLQALQKGSLNKNVFEIQSELLNGKARIVFDLGANRGEVTQQYLNVFPNAKLHSFEPTPEVFSKLKNRFNQNPNVVCNELAVSDKNEGLTFFVNKSVDTNSILESNTVGLNSDQAVKNIDQIKVQAIKLDSYCQQNNIDTIDILKMDIQGGESAALKGAENLLKSKSIKLIYTEAYFVEQYKNQPLFYQIADYLKQFDYVLQDIYNPIYGKKCLAWCDAIFIHRDLIK